MTKRSKSYQQAAALIDSERLYSPLEAVKLAKQTTTTKRFDATVEVAMRLGIDPRKADQMVRGTVSLPHGTGKTARVAVFATGDKADEARAAGGGPLGGGGQEGEGLFGGAPVRVGGPAPPARGGGGAARRRPPPPRGRAPPH